MDLKQEYKKIIEKANKKKIDIKYIAVPPKPELGDLSCTIAFKISKEKKKDPKEIAEKISEKIKVKGIIKDIKAVGPYINVFFEWGNIGNELLKEIIKKKSKFGSEKSKENILIEHTSINPTGPIHVGRIRNSFIGDTLVRVYKFLGWNVKTHYYVNDIGKQVAVIAWGFNNKIKPKKIIVERYKNFKKKEDFKVFFVYVPAYEIVSTNELKMKEVDKLIEKCEAGNKRAISKLKKVAKICLEGQKKTLDAFDIKFDSFDFESMFLEDNSVKRVIEKLKKLKQYKKLGNGAKVIDLRMFGIPKEEGTVFLRSNKTSVYLTRDIAYHFWKFKRTDKALTMLGEDHKLEFVELKTILNLLGALKNKDLDVAFLSFVNVLGQKMSTRKGITVPVDSLLIDGIRRAENEIKKRNPKLQKSKIKKIAEFIAKAAIRYSLLKINPLKPILFSWDEALSFEGNTGPYCQYAYVRASKIIKKAKKVPKRFDCVYLKKQEEINLIRILNGFQKTLQDTIEGKSPNILVNYVYNLAFNFNKFYENIKVLSEKNKNKRNARLALVFCISQVLKNGLNLLGINVPKQM